MNYTEKQSVVYGFPVALVLYISISLMAGSAAAEQAGAQTSRIGKSRIKLIAPPGFHAAGSYQGLTTNAVRKATPQTNRMLDYYLSSQDLYRVKHGANAFLHRYMVVQTHQRFETRDISNSQFQHVIEASQRRHQSLVFQLTKAKAENLHATLTMLRQQLGASFKLGRPAPLGVISRSDEHLTMAYIFNYSTNLVAGMNRRFRIGAVSIVRVKNKLLFLYVYGGYETSKDLNWIKDTSRRWVASILHHNQK